MSEFKGTKGIWEARRIAGELNVIVKGTLQTRRSFTTYRPVVDDVGCKHDANLISAAPELLEALELTILHFASEQVDMTEGQELALQKSLLAIKKALGEKS